MGFADVIAIIRAGFPDARLGETVQEHSRTWYPRASRLVYRPFHHTSERYPAIYVATEAGHRPMWLYVGPSQRICCGDKQCEWNNLLA